MTGVAAFGQSLPTHKGLEQAAVAFSTDATKLPALAAAVFSVSHFDEASLRHLPKPVALGLKDKFVAAEQAYWSGQKPGVSEQNIADVLNSFATALSLPEFAKTTPAQVRKLRMHILMGNPQFMRVGVIHKNSTDGSATAVSDMMSPLQALHVALSMIDQKFVNPTYQMTLEEWEAHESTGTQTPNGIYHRGNTPRIGQIQDSFREGMASLGDAECLALLNRAGSTMGVF